MSDRSTALAGPDQLCVGAAEVDAWVDIAPLGLFSAHDVVALGKEPVGAGGDERIRAFLIRLQAYLHRSPGPRHSLESLPKVGELLFHLLQHDDIFLFPESHLAAVSCVLALGQCTDPFQANPAVTQWCADLLESTCSASDWRSSKDQPSVLAASLDAQDPQPFQQNLIARCSRTLARHLEGLLASRAGGSLDCNGEPLGARLRSICECCLPLIRTGDATPLVEAILRLAMHVPVCGTMLAQAQFVEADPGRQAPAQPQRHPRPSLASSVPKAFFATLADVYGAGRYSRLSHPAAACVFSLDTGAFGFVMESVIAQVVRYPGDAFDGGGCLTRLQLWRLCRCCASCPQLYQELSHYCTELLRLAEYDINLLELVGAMVGAARDMCCESSLLLRSEEASSELRPLRSLLAATLGPHAAPQPLEWATRITVFVKAAVAANSGATRTAHFLLSTYFPQWTWVVFEMAVAATAKEHVRTLASLMAWYMAPEETNATRRADLEAIYTNSLWDKGRKMHETPGSVSNSPDEDVLIAGFGAYAVCHEVKTSPHEFAGDLGRMKAVVEALDGAWPALVRRILQSWAEAAQQTTADQELQIVALMDVLNRRKVLQRKGHLPIFEGRMMASLELTMADVVMEDG